MSGLAFLIEIRQSDLDALHERVGSAGPHYPFCTIGIRRYWISRASVRNQGPLAPGPGDWQHVTAIEESENHYFFLLGTAQAHVLPKRALDQTVQGTLRQLAAELPSLEPLLASRFSVFNPFETSARRLVRAGSRWVGEAALGLLGGIRLATTLTLSRTLRELESGPVTLLGFTAIVVVALATVDFFLVPSPRQLNPWSFPLDATWLLLTVVMCYLPVRVLASHPGTLEGVLTRLAAAALVPLVAGKLYVDLELPLPMSGSLPTSDSGGSWLVYAWTGWLGLIALGIFRSVVPLHGARSVALGAYLFGAIAIIFDVVPTVPAWASYEVIDSEPVRETAPLDYHLNVETTYYVQPQLLRRALSGLLPERPGVEDLYFVGFAGDARQDVFMREVRNIRRFLDSDRGTKNRSVLLINHPDVVAEVPLANRHNLAVTLGKIGQLMNPEEDTLFLYMTSHGSRDGRFVVRFPPLGLTDLRPDELGSILDASRIRWQVVAVSACFSGSFVESLTRPTALIMTAARADRSSFGCENGRDYTYFGEALRAGLERTLVFPDAFEFARKRVVERELAEGKDPSFPQISMGVEIARRIERAPSPTPKI